MNTKRPMHIEPLSDVMGAAALDIDLKHVDAETCAVLNRVFLDAQVLCVREQAFTPAEYVRAAAHFGEVQRQLLRQYWHPDEPDISIVASDLTDNVGDGKPIVRGPYWHTDDSFFAVPAKATILYAVQTPEQGGDTHFANMYAAYDALAEASKVRIADLLAVHKYYSRRAGAKVAKRSAEEEAQTPDAIHPLVRMHPDTRRKALYLNPNRIDHIAGLPARESDALLDALYEHAFQPRFHYHHKWRDGDMVIWDNRCTMHRATGGFAATERRVMHRILLRGTSTTEETKTTATG